MVRLRIEQPAHDGPSEMAYDGGDGLTDISEAFHHKETATAVSDVSGLDKKPEANKQEQ